MSKEEQYTLGDEKLYTKKDERNNKELFRLKIKAKLY